MGNALTYHQNRHWKINVRQDGAEHQAVAEQPGPGSPLFPLGNKVAEQKREKQVDPALHGSRS